MDLKELVNKINESLVEEKVSEDINNPYTVQELSIDTKDLIKILNDELDNLAKEDEDFDAPTKAMLLAAEELVENIKKFRKDKEDLKNANFEESVNEANSYTDNMLDGINVANKTINSDLEFNVQVKEVDGGVAFNANGTGVQYHPYKPVDHEASKEELADVVNRCADVIENKINELEDEIIGIFNERGFRK